MSHARTRSLVTSALLVALLAASAFVSVPVGAVPVTLQTFVVVLVALVFEPGQAAVVLALYLGLGAAGAPVFSGGQGGVAVLVGPTGGYLVGFGLGAVAGALARTRSRLAAPVGDVLAAAVVLAIVYALGASWLARSTGTTLAAAVAGGVAPFVFLDAAKAAGAVVVAVALRKAGLADTPSGIAPM